MADTVTCSRCGEEKPRMAQPPIPGAAGKKVQDNVCADCWAEWQGMEVMVINELRLNFMDPKAQEVLEKQMFEFLALDGGSGNEADLPVPPPEER